MKGIESIERKGIEVSKGIEIINLGIKIGKTFIISDVHLGYEEALIKKGVFTPRMQYQDTIKKLEMILENTPIETIVINGDLKHEFGTISNQEWADVIKFIDFLSSYGKVVLVKGNHDKTLGPIAKKKGLKIVDSYTVGDTLITHGDIVPKIIPDKIKNIIIGHEHPAVSVVGGPRTEKFKCFLVGKFKKRNLIVQPSMNLLTEGNDIITEEIISPFLKVKLDNFKVFIVADKIYEFGKVGNLI